MSETGTLLEWRSIYFLGWKLLVRILKTSFQEFHHWFNVRSNVTHMSWMRIQFNKWIVFLRTRRYLAPNGSYCYISFSQFLWNGVLMQFYDSQNVDLSILMHEYNLQLYGRYFWVFFFMIYMFEEMTLRIMKHAILDVGRKLLYMSIFLAILDHPQRSI